MLCVVDYGGFFCRYYNSIFDTYRINISCSYNACLAKREKY